MVCDRLNSAAEMVGVDGRWTIGGGAKALDAAYMGAARIIQ